MDVLLGWLTTSGNYVRWRGGSSSGDTKEVLCKEILKDLRAAGIHHRTTDHVRSKIKDLQQGYTRARDWLACTGQGILDNAKEDEDVQRILRGMLCIT